MGVDEQFLLDRFLVAEHYQDREKEERWLPQAPEDPLDENEEPFEPESRIVPSPEEPLSGLRFLNNKQHRLVNSPVYIDQIVLLPVPPCKLNRTEPNEPVSFVMTKFYKKQPPRSSVI